MKKCFVNIFFISTISLFITGCTQLYQSHSQLQPAQNNSAEKESLSANYFFLESRIHIKNRQFESAVKSLQKALKHDPGSFILNRDLIQLYFQQKKEKKALDIAENFVQLNPDNVNGLLLLVQLKKDAMDEEELVSILNKILLIDPENRETFLRLGKIYMEKDDNTSALALFQKMVRQFPDYYVSWFYLGEIYLAQKEYELAKNQFLKTVELEPELIQPRFQLINIYKATNFAANKNSILQTYQKILEIEPDNYRAQMGIGLHYYQTNMRQKAQAIFMKLGREIDRENSSGSRLLMIAVDEYITAKRYQDAVIVFSQMLKANPDSSTLNFFTAMAYEAAQNLDKAIFHYLKIKPDYPQYKKTILTITFLYKELGKNKTAITYLEGKHRQLPDDIDIIIYLASFYEKDKKYKKAIEILKQGTEKSPENTSLLFRLGATLDKAGFKQESLEIMEKIIQIDPEDASALNYLGYSYAEQGVLLDKALELIKKADAIKPDDGYITDSLGWVYYKMGEFEKAVKILEKAAELTSFETIISDHLGDAYMMTEQFENALNTYKKALANAKEEDKTIVLKLKEKINALQKRINE